MGIFLPKFAHPDFIDPSVKPQNTVIDWDNPLTKGLKFYPVVIGNQVVDLVSGQIGVITGTGISFENTSEGLAVVSSGTSQVLFADIPHNIGSGPFTIITRFIWDGSTGSWQTAISLPNHNEIGIYLPREFGTQWMASDTTSGGVSSWSGASVVADVGGTYSISISDGSSSILDGYKDGLFQTLTGSSDPLLSEDGTTGVNLFNGQGSEYAHGKMIYSMVYDRQLSAAEQYEIHHRPYQILKPAVPISYFIKIEAGDFTLIAETTAYTYTGTAASLLLSALLTAETDAYSYTGTAADLNLGRPLVAETAQYTYSGTSADLLLAATFDAETAQYTYTGTAANTLFGAYISGETAQYTYTGTEADLAFEGVGAFTLVAETDQYNYTGTSADILRGASFDAETAQYTYSGTIADLNLGRTLTAETAQYTYSGTAAALQAGRIMISDSGSYIITGTDATLTATGDVWTVEPDTTTTWTNETNAVTTWTQESNETTVWTVEGNQ